VTRLQAPVQILGNSQLFCANTIENMQDSFVEIQGSVEGLPGVPERLCEVATCPAALLKRASPKSQTCVCHES